ncbi:MAG: hypothetical protein JST19_02135 [Bacteroidetes bacterium]|nr:hypothetical protein [Bacteroidota bacterium]
MEQKYPDDELRFVRHSDEIQDIMTKIPSGVVRWGMTLFLLVFILIFALAAFIRYPDVITTTLKISPASQNGAVSGVAIIPQNALSRVTARQIVIISVKRYPFEQYGVLKGEIGSVSGTLDEQNNYSAVVLIRSDVTSSGMKILLQPGMLADAKVVTRDESLLKRLLARVF